MSDETTCIDCGGPFRLVACSKCVERIGTDERARRVQMEALASGLCAAIHRTIDGPDKGRKAAAWKTVFEFTSAIERLTPDGTADPHAVLESVLAQEPPR